MNKPEPRSKVKAAGSGKTLTREAIREIAAHKVSAYAERRARLCGQSLEQTRSGQVRVSRRDTRSVLEGSAPAIATDWMTGRLIALNMPALEAIGDRPRRAATYHVWDLWPESGDDTMLDDRAALWSAGEIQFRDRPLLRRDGTVLNVDILAILTRVAGKFIGVFQYSINPRKKFDSGHNFTG